MTRTNLRRAWEFPCELGGSLGRERCSLRVDPLSARISDNMSDSITAKTPSAEQNGTVAGSQVNVFAVHGVDPEVQAYAMAKYSRSALSMKESLREVSEQKAEWFLNTF